MAESINIPIQIVTKEALNAIKDFSKLAEKNFKSLNKVIDKENELLDKNLKSITQLNKEHKNLNGATEETESNLKKVNESTKKQIILFDSLTRNQKILGGSVVAVGIAAATQTEEFKSLINTIKNIALDTVKLTSRFDLVIDIFKKTASAASFFGIGALGIQAAFKSIGVDTKKLIATLNTISKVFGVVDNEILNLISRSADLVSTGLTQVTISAEEQTKKIEELKDTIKTFGEVTGIATGALALKSKTILELVNKYTGLNLKTVNYLQILKDVVKGSKSAITTTNAVAKAYFTLDRGLFGLAINLGSISAAFALVSKVTKGFENTIVNLISRISLIISLITGSLSIALSLLIKKVASLAYELGTVLANAAVKATETFVEFEKKTFIFERTLTGFNRAFGDGIGTVNSWNKSIRKLSDETGFTEKSLRGAVTEIVATTSAMGFNEKQQKKLLEITTDYARFLGDDVIQTTIEFISALNGQAQSVQKYGVKLGATNLQQKLYNKGVNQTFQSLSETEKVQTRWGSLLKQYVPIAGTAAAVTNTLAGQQIVLNNNTTRLAQSFGEGAAIIESNNLLAAASNLILNNVNETVIKATGFLTSFVGRLLQAGGALLSVSFNIFAVVKALKILNLILKSDIFETLISTKIPLLSKSFKDIIKLSGAASVSFKSFGAIVKTLSTITLSQAKIAFSAVIVQIKLLIGALFGVEAATVSFAVVLRGAMIKSLVLAKSALAAFAKVLLAFLANPIVLTIAAISAAIYALFQALKVINERTGIFTELWESLVESFKETASIFKPLNKLFKSFGSIILNISKRAFGLFVFGVSKVISSFLTLIKLITDGVKKLKSFSLFSSAFAGVEIDDAQLTSIEKARDKLDTFSDSLFNVGFEITQLKEKTERATSSVNENIKKIDLQPLIKLQEELKDIGLTDLDKLKRQRNERLKVIQEGLKSEGEAFRIAKELERKINLDFNNQLAEIRKTEKDKREEEEKKRLEFIENYKKSFAETEKEISGILAKIGKTATDALSFTFGGGQTDLEKKLDDNLEELKQNFKSGKIGEIEFELEKKKLKKQKKELEKNTALGISTGILNSLARGKQGAKDLAKGIGTLAADLIVPGLGQAVGPLLEVFSQGPEEVKKMVAEFANALPDLIENIILSIPAFIEAIAENVDVIIVRLVEKVDDIIIALVRAIPRVSSKLAIALAFDVPFELAKASPKIALNLAKEFALKIPGELLNGVKKVFSDSGVLKIFKNIGSKIFNGLFEALKGIGNFFYNLGKDIFTGLFEVLRGGFSLLSNLFKAIFGFDGGGTGVVEDFLGFDFPFIAFSKGGMVPGAEKVKADSPLNDTVPALLSAGEIVIPKSAVNKGMDGIFSFLKDVGYRPKGFFLGDVVEGIGGFLTGAVSGAFNAATSFIREGGGAVDAIVSPTGEIYSYAIGYMRQFAEYLANPELYIEILRSLARIGASINLKELFTNPIRALKRALLGVTSFFQPFFRQIIGAGLPFAQGGIVPGGFPNDNFPARLTSGELVVDRSTTRDLQEFLAEQGPGNNGGGSDTVIGLLSQIANLLQNGQTIETSVDFEGDTLANIILNLNRNNARIA